MSDDNGRDLVSQHLLSYTKDTYNHFKTLSNLFTRLKLSPHDSYDQSGYNAFHYLAAFDPMNMAQKLARDKEEIAKDKVLRKKGAGSRKGAVAESSDDETSDMDVDEEENKDGDNQKISKQDKRAQMKYAEVRKQIVEIA